MKGKKETKVERKIYGGIQPLNFSGWQKVLGTADRALTSGFPVEVVGVTGEDADTILHLEGVATELASKQLMCLSEGLVKDRSSRPPMPKKGNSILASRAKVT